LPIVTALIVVTEVEATIGMLGVMRVMAFVVLPHCEADDGTVVGYGP
jgi:hypothetical protein